MAIPSIVGVSPLYTATTSPTSCALPTGTQSGDYVVAFVETENMPVAALSGAGSANFQQMATPIGKGVGDQSGSTRLTAYKAIMTSASDTGAATLSNSGDHTNARFVTLRGVNVASAVNVLLQRVDATGSTAMAWPTDGETTVNNCLVLAACSLTDDANSTTRVSSFAGTNLTNVTERWDQTVNTGLGGGSFLATGELATAGAIGSPTAVSYTSSRKEYLLIALAGN